MPTEDVFGVDAKTAGDFLREVIDRKDLTQSWLAEQIGTHENYVGQFVNGKTNWTRGKYLVPIMSALGITEKGGGVESPRIYPWDARTPPTP